MFSNIRGFAVSSGVPLKTIAPSLMAQIRSLQAAAVLMSWWTATMVMEFSRQADLRIVATSAWWR